MSNLIGWFGFLFSMCGQLLIIYKNRYAFIIWNIGNVIWLYLAIKNNDLAQVFMFIIYIIINVVTFIKWKNKKTAKF
jgi:nicotinamide riboside transporter PnuC